MGSPEFSPKGISVDAVRSRPIGLAIPGNKEAPSVNEERTQAQDDASSYSGKKAKKATNEVSCPSFSFKKPSFTLSHLGRRAEQATGGTLSLTSVTDRFPLLFDSSGKTRENKKGLWPSFFRPGSLSPFTHVGKNAEQDIKDGVSLSSLAGKLPVSPGHSRKKLSGKKSFDSHAWVIYLCCNSILSIFFSKYFINVVIFIFPNLCGSLFRSREHQVTEQYQIIMGLP